MWRSNPGPTSWTVSPQASAAPTCPQPYSCAQAGMSPGGRDRERAHCELASELLGPGGVWPSSVNMHCLGCVGVRMCACVCTLVCVRVCVT